MSGTAIAPTTLDLSRGRREFLRQRESLALQDVEGTVVSVEQGCLWITQEHDMRDIVLLPGMRFEIDRTGLTIVTAEEDSRFRLGPAESACGCASANAHSHASSAWQAAAQWFEHRVEQPARRWVPYF